MSEKNRPIKIAFLSMRDPRDRQQWSGLIYYTAQALQKYCGEVEYWDIYSTFSYKIINFIGILIREGSAKLLKRRYTFSFFWAKWCAIAATRWFAGRSFDVIVAPDGAMETAFLETNIPVVLVGDSTQGQLFDYYPTFSNMLKRSIYENQTVQSMALKKASAALYASTWAAQSAIQDYATDPHKVHVVPFGANFDESPSRELALARKKSQQCCLLFLGVEWQRKGGEIAFETLLKLEELGIQAELIVCGCVPPKKFVHKQMKVIPFLNKNDPQQHEELNKLFLHADFLFVPTRGECYGLVFCEANAFGLPVIATNTGGVSEIVRDGENGYLLPPDAGGSAYAEVIARIYRDDQRYAEMVRASRAAFEERLNWEVWGMATKKILAELVHRGAEQQVI